MSDPSYTTKWRCKDCGSLYGHNPGECDVCGHTIFRPLPADSVSETFEGGEEKTELGENVSELVNQIDYENPPNENTSAAEEPTDEVATEDKSGTSLLSRLWPW
jgi:rubredoxin